MFVLEYQRFRGLEFDHPLLAHWRKTHLVSLGATSGARLSFFWPSLLSAVVGMVFFMAGLSHTTPRWMIIVSSLALGVFTTYLCCLVSIYSMLLNMSGADKLSVLLKKASEFLNITTLNDERISTINWRCLQDSAVRILIAHAVQNIKIDERELDPLRPSGGSGRLQAEIQYIQGAWSRGW